MNSVFISYVREDDAIVESFCTSLRRRGIAVWRDKEALGAGDRWKREVRVAIQHGTCFIACFSDNLSLRRRSYMYEELMLAVDELRQRPPSRAWFIPVRLSPCEIPDIPIGGGETLAAFHLVDLFRDWEQGVDAVARAIHAAQKAGGSNDQVGAQLGARTLIHELRSEDPREREIAVLNLRNMLPTSEEAKFALEVALLTETDSKVVARIEDALAFVGEDILTDLFRMLDDLVADPIRHASGIRAISVLKRLGRLAEPAISRLVAVLRSSAPAEDAVEVLGRLGEPAIPALLELATDIENMETRQRAYGALGIAGEAAAPAVPALVEALRGSDYDTIAAAAAALGKIRTYPELSVPALASASYHCSESHPPWPGSSAIAALGKYGEAAVPAIPTLIAHVKSHDEGSPGRQAAKALGKIGRPSLGPLLDTLHDADSLVASRCAVALGMIGSGAYRAVPDLCRIADQQAQPATEIVKAIGQIGNWSDSVYGTLLRCMKSAEEYHWPGEFLAALSAAAKLGPRAAPLLPEALKYIGEETAGELVINFAVSAAEKAIPELIRMIPSNPTPRTYNKLTAWNSTKCLAVLAATYEDARSVVTELARYDDYGVRASVAQGIGQARDDKRLSDWSLRLLNQLADDDNQVVRSWAIAALPK